MSKLVRAQDDCVNRPHVVKLEQKTIRRFNSKPFQRWYVTLSFGGIREKRMAVSFESAMWLKYGTTKTEVWK